jgi:hypothetical protein
MSVLVNKYNTSVRNNVKYSMINKLVFDIDKCISSLEDVNYSINNRRIDIKLNKIDKLNTNFMAATQNIPCINVNCEFKKYLLIFYPKLNLFLLPAFNSNYHCIVCDMIQNGKLKRSEIKISDKLVIQFKKL